MHDETSSSVVLVVGGDANITSLIKHTLTPLGYIVDDHDHDNDVLRCVIEKKPALIIVDIEPANTDAATFTTQLRKSASVGNIPIVALTPRDREPDVLQGQRLRVNAYLRKPFSPRALASMIEDVLREAHRTDAPEDTTGPTPPASPA